MNSEMTMKASLLQSSNSARVGAAKSAQDVVRRKKQARFFSELRILKTASRLNIEQNEFACHLINGVQRGDIAFLNKLLVNSPISLEELRGAVAGAQRVLDTCNVVVCIEEQSDPLFRLWLHHAELGSVCIGAVDSQFGCTDTVQDIALSAIAERVSDFFVMY